MKINVGYNNILVYDGCDNPIIYEPNNSKFEIFWNYDGSVFTNKTIELIETKHKIKFPYKFKNTDSEELRHDINIFHSHSFPFYNFENNFEINNGLVSDFIERGENFIYPIMLLDSHIFKLPTIDLPINVVKSLKEGKAKLVFTYNYEGHFGQVNQEFRWLSDLSSKYGLNKNNNIIITGNMIANDIKENLIQNNYIFDNFTIIPFSWFGYNLFFHTIFNGEKMKPDTKKSFNETFEKFLKNNRTVKKEFHFLSFNRIPKTHRLCIFKELMTNDEFINKFIVSLGSVKMYNNNEVSFYKMILNEIENTYKYDKQKLLDFYTTYNQNEHYVYDCSDFENNKADTLNSDAQSKTFVNIVNESLTHNKTVFFSEKIYKPIYSCQPFILVSSPYSLKKLKEMGYRTFDKWWDESYDLETNFTKRLGMIVDLMFEISSWSLDKCFQVTNEMEEILIHNFNVMMNDDDIINLFKYLTWEKEQSYSYTRMSLI